MALLVVGRKASERRMKQLRIRVERRCCVREIYACIGGLYLGERSLKRRGIGFAEGAASRQDADYQSCQNMANGIHYSSSLVLMLAKTLGGCIRSFNSIPLF